MNSISSLSQTGLLKCSRTKKGLLIKETLHILGVLEACQSMRWYFSPLHSWECPFVPWKADIFLCHNGTMSQGGRCLWTESAQRPRAAGGLAGCCFSGRLREGVPGWGLIPVLRLPPVDWCSEPPGSRRAQSKEMFREVSTERQNHLFLSPLMWRKGFIFFFCLIFFSPPLLQNPCGSGLKGWWPRSETFGMLCWKPAATFLSG